MVKKKNNRKCIICGKEYSYCPICGQDLKKPSWYTIFCGDNCNEIYETVTAYRDGGCTLDAARDILNGLDLSDVDNDGFNKTTRKQIKEILGEVVEQEVVESNTAETVEKAVEEVDKVVEKEVVESTQKENEKPKNNGFKQSNNYDKHNNKNFRK